MPAGTIADMTYVDDEGNILREISKFPPEDEQIVDPSEVEAENLTN